MLPQTTNGVVVTRDIVQLRLLLQLDEEAGVIDVVAADYDKFPTGASSDGASMGQNKKFMLWSADFQSDRTGDLMSAIPDDNTVDHPWPASIFIAMIYRHLRTTIAIVK
ncbi:MAG: hypothetical protein LQ338_001956 [Usnochroma carphineum]|nr:MAG: hypothetical protein LQ338_001956 [Usnochroma carphineum]